MVKKISPFPAVFSNAQKGRKGEKETGTLNCKKRWGPKVQRRENVGGSLNPWGPFDNFKLSKSNGLILLTNRNVIHFIRFVKYFCQKFFSYIFYGGNPGKTPRLRYWCLTHKILVNSTIKGGML